MLMAMFVRDARAQLCIAVPPCRIFTLTSYRTYAPTQISTPAVITLNGDVNGTASLDNTPIAFAIPTRFNVTAGGSADQTASLVVTTITVDSRQQPQNQTIQCLYQGNGAAFVALRTNGDAYLFVSCSVISGFPPHVQTYSLGN